MSDWTSGKHIQDPNQTTPGVRMLKDLWNSGKKKEREVAHNVSTDIYKVAPSAKQVPRRHRPGG